MDTPEIILVLRKILEVRRCHYSSSDLDEMSTNAICTVLLGSQTLTCLSNSKLIPIKNQ